MTRITPTFSIAPSSLLSCRSCSNYNLRAAYRKHIAIASVAVTAGGDNATHREAIAPTLPLNQPICNHQKLINFMAQSFWQNLFIFQSAVAATTITAAIAIATPTKALEQPISSPQILPPNLPNPNQITPPISTPREPDWWWRRRCLTEFPNRCQPWIPEQPGASQQNPIMPTVTRPNWWRFFNVPRGNWVDPPTAYGFRYEMTSDSLFTEIIDFPTGFANPFTVLVKDAILGEFTAGDSVNFSNYSTLLGDLLVSDRGVKEFSIIGLNVDPTNPTAFPLQLDFNTDTANFNMYPLLNEESKSIPEPSTILGLLTSSAFLVNTVRKRQQKLPD